jgi:hypothetical protein
MRILIIAILLLIINVTAMSQIFYQPIVIDTAFLHQFIQKKSVNFKFTKNSEAERMPFFTYKVNREIKTQSDKYSLYGIPLHEIYAYIDSNEQFCLYAVMSLEKGFNPLTDVIGMPENVTQEDFEALDFDFLFWELKNEITITVFPHRSSKWPRACLIYIMNMDFKDILREKVYEFD